MFTACRQAALHGFSKRLMTLAGFIVMPETQWLRASQSIPLNIAEGNGKTAEADRRRYFEIARGSALECAAIQDVLVVGQALAETESRERKIELDRMAAMLSRLGGRGYCVKEGPAAYGYEEIDFDTEETKSKQAGALDAHPSRQ